MSAGGHGGASWVGTGATDVNPGAGTTSGAGGASGLVSSIVGEGGSVRVCSPGGGETWSVVQGGSTSMGRPRGWDGLGCERGDLDLVGEAEAGERGEREPSVTPGVQSSGDQPSTGVGGAHSYSRSWSGCRVRWSTAALFCAHPARLVVLSLGSPFPGKLRVVKNAGLGNGPIDSSTVSTWRAWYVDG